MRRIVLRLCTLVVLACGIAVGETNVIVRVGPQEGDVVGNDHMALQKAADWVAERAPEGGGILQIAEGTYRMDDSLHIRAPMTVRGAGAAKTILRKAAAQRVAKLTVEAALKDSTLTLDDASWIKVGDGITLRYDGRTSAWGNVLRTVIRVEGNVVTIDRAVADEPSPKPGDPTYGPPGEPYPVGSLVVNSHPLVDAISRRWNGGDRIRGVTVEDLTCDGNKGENMDHFIDGCRSGAIYLFGGERCTIRRCELKDFAGDGASWQFVHDVVVEDCVAAGNGTVFAGNGGNGYGFHPGTGSLRTIIRNCKGRSNGDNGLFVCWNIKNGLFEGNTFEANGNHGISIGHDDTDNRFVGNVIRRNGHTGVWFRRETPHPDRNVFARNVIEDNGSADRPGMGMALCEVTGIVLEKNTIRDTRPAAERTQKIALGATGKGPSTISVMKGNTIEGEIAAVNLRLPTADGQ